MGGTKSKSQKSLPPKDEEFPFPSPPPPDFLPYQSHSRGQFSRINMVQFPELYAEYAAVLDLNYRQCALILAELDTVDLTNKKSFYLAHQIHLKNQLEDMLTSQPHLETLLSKA